MIHKKFKIFIIFCLFVFGQVSTENSGIIEKIEKKYQKALDIFSAMNQKPSDLQIRLMPQFFLQFNVSYSEIAKRLHQDVNVVTKEIKVLKRVKESWQKLDLLKNQLSTVYNFIKKHRLQYEVVVFHQSIQDNWNVLFQALAKGQDIVTLLESVGIEQKDVDGLKALVKQVEKDLRKIEIYEYRLHTDWIDTKLANYVLNIELTRLRNAILFHPLYKKTKLKLSSNYPR